MDVRAYAETRKSVCSRIKKVIVEELALEMDPEFITDNQPLFGRGLELDSIDAMELAIGIFSEFNVTVTDGDNSIFSSVNSIADFVMANGEEFEHL